VGGGIAACVAGALPGGGACRFERGGNPGSGAGDAAAGAGDGAGAGAGTAAGAGGGDTTIVASRCLPGSAARDSGGGSDAGWLLGTLGKPPPRVEPRGSDGDADADGATGSPDEPVAARSARSPRSPRSLRSPRSARRGTGPCQSQIERPESDGEDGAAVPDPANAGVSPGSAGALGALGSTGGADDAGAGGGGGSAVIVTSGSSSSASPAAPSPLPAASPGVPSWPR
jgi:hypothetical protein